MLGPVRRVLNGARIRCISDRNYPSSKFLRLALIPAELSSRPPKGGLALCLSWVTRTTRLKLLLKFCLRMKLITNLRSRFVLNMRTSAARRTDTLNSRPTLTR